jgi:hypothetical protein
MAPRCFPEEPEFESPAERAVWLALRDKLPEDAALFANRRFTDRKGDCEADIIVGLPGAGIAVVEVKGGAVAHDGHTWRQTGGGAHGKVIDPVEQGRRSKYALRTYLDGMPLWRRRRGRYAHLVAFPASRVPADFQASDCPRWMVIDRDQVDDAAGLVRAALTDQHAENPPAQAADIDDLVECLAGRPPAQRDLVAEADAREHQCDLLTGQQAKVLDYIRSLHRVEVRGGAGSGKTWLALEQARRLSASGRRVGLLCYSRGLSAYLRRRVQLLRRGERPAYVGTFHNLGVEWGAPPGTDDDSDYWERRLPHAMTGLAAHLSEQERYDAFVVDEAQDFSDAWWPALISGLRAPDRGGLYAFADEGQRVFARTGRPPVDLAPIELDENLRNTKQIAQTFGSLARAQMRYRGGEGVPVRFIQCASAEAVTAADDEVDSLLADGWAHQHVALLTTGHRHFMQRERQSRGQDHYWASYWEHDDVFYGHVLGFKGLERPAVVLAVNGFSTDESRAREKLYVGLSRARDLLTVCGDLELIGRIGGEGVVRRLTS